MPTEENIPDALKRTSALDKPPEFEPGEIYGIASGSFNHEDGLWKTTISLKADLCLYEANHPSGISKTFFGKRDWID